MGKVIGIDLGTTNSCVAVLKGGQPIVIPNTEGGRTTPSMVGFGRAGDRLVGQLAKRQTVTNAENTIFSIKRFIGRRWDETEPERSRIPYNCIRGKDDTVDVQIRGKSYTPQEISAMILQKLKQDAESYLGEPVTQAIIAISACFTHTQQQAVIDAGTIAGLEVLCIINEPTAAALAYGMDKQDQDQCILVFDLGGGTFDVSILQLGDGVFEVKATSGNNHLGGDDFDDVIVRWMIEAFEAQNGIDLSIDKMALQRLREAAERAKIELTGCSTTVINLPFITADETGPKHLEMELTRDQFERLASHLIESTMELTRQTLNDADLTVDDIDRVLLVGRSICIPAVQEAIREYFNGKPLDHSVNPDEAVALGAAVQTEILNGILKFSIRDEGAGQEQNISITNTGGLSSTEIERMRQEAEVFAEENQNRKLLVELKNQAESLFYSYETTIRDNSEFISEELKALSAERMADLKAAIANPNITVEAMRQKLDALQQTLLDIGTTVYQQTDQDWEEIDDLFDDDEGGSAATIGTRPRLPRSPNDFGNFDGFADENLTIP